jgi:hypothetical protein
MPAELAEIAAPKKKLHDLDIDKFNLDKSTVEKDPAAERQERIKAANLTPIKLPNPDSVVVVFFRQFFPFATLAVFGILLASFIGLRTMVVQKAPGMLAVYNFIGISPLPPGGGISIVNVRDESRFGSIDNALVLNGQLVNHTPTTLKVPLFKLNFTSTQGQTKTFMARNPIEKIEPGAMVPFKLERPGFAQLGWRVQLSFGDGTEGDDTGKAVAPKTPEKH